jgi:hypothetical protein
MFGNIDDGHMKLFQKLLHLDVMRGPHSTGILVVDEAKGEERNYYLYKSLGVPDRLYQKYSDDFGDDGTYVPHKTQKVCLLMGHNRYATQGAINEDNAHPFEFDNVIGAHNGTVDDWALNKLDGYKKFPVDSQVLYHHISENSLADMWEKVTWGAMALSYYDFRDETFNLARNDERPLWVGRIGKDIMVYASEKWMLDVASAYSRYHIHSVEELPINTHARWSYDEEKNILSVKTEKLPEYTYTPSTYTMGGNTSYRQHNSKRWLKITDFVPFSGGSSKKHGYFVGEELYNKKSNVPYRITMMSGPEKAYDTIMSRAADGRVFYSFVDDAVLSGGYLGPSITFEDLSWEQYMSLKTPMVPDKTQNKGAKKKDSEGNDIDYFDWLEASEDGCISCFSPIPAVDWNDKTGLYYFHQASKTCLCPLCNTKENRDLLKDIIEV